MAAASRVMEDGVDDEQSVGLVANLHPVLVYCRVLEWDGFGHELLLMNEKHQRSWGPVGRGEAGAGVQGMGCVGAWCFEAEV